MAIKKYVLPDQTVVSVHKTKASRSLKMTITSSGVVRVSIPAWAPYKAGLQFAVSRAEWIAANRPLVFTFTSGQAIGKAHHLVFRPDTKIAKPVGRLCKTEAVVLYPSLMDVNTEAVQKVAHRVAVRALRAQADALLPQRISTLALEHGFHYTSLQVKLLKSRWGSCDAQQRIVLNLFLMQLPWECIDYVILHELTHTIVHQHGPLFWAAMQKVLPEVSKRRLDMKHYQPYFF